MFFSVDEFVFVWVYPPGYLGPHGLISVMLPSLRNWINSKKPPYIQEFCCLRAGSSRICFTQTIKMTIEAKAEKVRGTKGYLKMLLKGVSEIYIVIFDVLYMENFTINKKFVIQKIKECKIISK